MQGKLGGGPLTQQLDTHLSAMDANGDSKVSQDEFLEHMGWVSGVLEDDANFANYIKVGGLLAVMQALQAIVRLTVCCTAPDYRMPT